MKIRQLLNQFFPSTLRVLEHASINGEPHVSGIIVTRKKGEFDIKHSFEFSDLAAITSYVKKGETASLLITGAQVLTKAVPSTGNPVELLAKAYPNLNLEDFYYEVLVGKEVSFVAICRKEYVTALLQSYHEIGIAITDFSLGNIQAAYVTPYLDTAQFQTMTAAIQHTSHDITAISERETGGSLSYAIGDTEVADTHVLPLAGVLKKMGAEAALFDNHEDSNTALQKAVSEQQFFKYALFGGIAVLLAVLLINFFVFSSSYTKWQQLQEEEQLYASHKKQLETRRQLVKNKEAVVNSILRTGFSKSSWYIDQIIQLQPKSVVLDQFVFQPLAKNMRKTKAVQLTLNSLVIAGVTTEKEAFSHWLQQLEALAFVKDLKIIQYSTSKKNNSTFEILLTITQS